MNDDDNMSIKKYIKRMDCSFDFLKSRITALWPVK